LALNYNAIIQIYFNICKIAGNTLGIRYTLSKEARDNISKGHLGHIAWNKGLTNIYSEKTKKQMSFWKDKKMSLKTKRKMRKAKLGKKATKETKKRQQIAQKKWRNAKNKF
jgi:hypothetical protein